MLNTQSAFSGVVEELWRYPVKSMQGEKLNQTGVTERGLLGDRAYALATNPTGRLQQPRIHANGRTCSTTVLSCLEVQPLARSCQPLASLVQTVPRSVPTMPKLRECYRQRSSAM